MEEINFTKKCRSIGVISDTHVSGSGELPKVVFEIFRGVDLILHAGDMTDEAVIDDLKKIAPVIAVRGNLDWADLPDRLIIHIGNFDIGLWHGTGAPEGIIGRAYDAFNGYEVDAIVFGHSHQVVNEVRHNILFFNTGSPTDRLFTTFNSVGILHLDGSIKGKIIPV